MAERVSAGLVMYRFRRGELQVFLAHPGGPRFALRDHGYWTIPKGEVERGEPLQETAIREFREEVGLEPRATTRFIDLGWIRQKGGKIVHAWGFDGDWDERQPVVSNTFEMEWPPGSGVNQVFPEVDRAAFFPLSEARVRIKPTQIPLIDRLETALKPS